MSAPEASREQSWPYDLPRSGNDAISRAVDDIDTSVFREYDVRGRVRLNGQDEYTLDEFIIGRIARAFGTYLRTQNIAKAVVGYDSRSYSEPLANALLIGLMSTGMDVVNIGLATTPMVYFAQHHLGGLAGISVTASHNPNGWAGLKLSNTPSVTLGPAELEKLSKITIGREFATGSGRYFQQSVTEDYVDYLAAKLPASRKMTAVIDGGNSISGPVAELVLKKAGYEVIAINNELDWTFPNHEPDPETIAARRQIERAVVDHQADCGISLDGDGDRLGLTDDKGGFVAADQVLSILAQDVLRRRPGAPIVYDVKCSRAVGEVITRSGGQPVMWMTGHSHIKAKMREINAPFAGERSGHFFDAGDYFGYDDGIYAALKFLHIVANQQFSASHLIDELPHYETTPTMQAECADAEKYRIVDLFSDYAESLGANEILRINGVRAEFDDGWLLVRASSNLPALVIVAEADTRENLSKYYRLIRDFLDTRGEVSQVWSNDPWQ